MSTRETILAAVATALAGVAGGRVYRTRQEQIATLPAVEITQVGSASDEIVLGLTDHTLSVRVAVLAKGDTPDTAADATLLAAHAALMADLTLGLGSEVQLQVRWEADEPEIDQFDYIRHAHRYAVSYRTATASF